MVLVASLNTLVCFSGLVKVNCVHDASSCDANWHLGSDQLQFIPFTVECNSLGKKAPVHPNMAEEIYNLYMHLHTSFFPTLRGANRVANALLKTLQGKTFFIM